MDEYRLLYLILYIIYLIGFILIFWYLLSYCRTPSYIFFILMVGIIILLIGAFMKEYVHIDYDYYIWLYLTVNIIGLIVVAIGIGYAIFNSDLTWGIWVAFALGLILSVIGNMLAIIFPNDFLSSCVVSIIAFTVYIIGLFLLLGYGPRAINLDLTINDAFWFFPFLGLIIIFGILSVIFEGLSLPIKCCDDTKCCEVIEVKNECEDKVIEVKDENNCNDQKY